MAVTGILFIMTLLAFIIISENDARKRKQKTPKDKH